MRRSIGERSRSVTEKYYSKDRYVSEIVAVYEKAIERKQGDLRVKYIIDQQKKIVLSKKNISLPDQNVFRLMNRIVQDNELSLIYLLRRLKQVPLFNFGYRYIAKPFYHILRKAKRLLKPS